MPIILHCQLTVSWKSLTNVVDVKSSFCRKDEYKASIIAISYLHKYKNFAIIIKQLFEKNTDFCSAVTFVPNAGQPPAAINPRPILPRRAGDFAAIGEIAYGFRQANGIT